MNKTSPATGALLAAFAAAALLQGCRTQQPGTPSRRTLFGGPTVPDVEVPAAVVRDGTGRPAPRPQPGPAPRPVPPEDGEILNPGEPVDTVPAPVRAPVPSAVPPAGPAGAGADSYRRYMGGGAPAPAPVRPAPAHPAPVQATGASVRPAPAPAPAPASENYRIHVVQPGESAGKIANANGMTLAEFVQVNGISDPNRLFEGQKVRVYAGRAPLSGRPAPASDPTEGGRYHVVRAGETLSSIAVLHNTSVGELQRLNRIADLNRIREGQRLALPGAGATPPPPPTPVSPRPPVPPTTRPVVTPPTTRPVVTPPTRPPVTPPTRPTPPPVREPTEPGIVEIGGTQVNSRELLAPGGSLMDVVTPEPPVTTPPTPPTPTTRPPTSTTRPPAPPTQAAVPAGAREYVVKDGEDLYSIGLAIGAKPYQIRLLNEGRNLEGLQPGDRIFVPAE